ncbi:MAG: hypothetical protein J0I42_04115 [Bosea sp.]|uniref:hypothetical protein n=1 Tax=Bosea sp. (in: a-proteobacteria) TaxID=1871050 RepID=UPI001AC65E7F|nr:hypothetical protein [Bosea sp. (in: a-proteobacteria)]MBN9451115.1 hypothetical protein [Bosea sp. (in: a-proteobacteria)]
MANLKLPTVQHFSTHCGGTVADIRKRIEKRAGGGSGISYETLRTQWLFDRFQLGIDAEQIEKAIKATLKPKNAKHNLAALQALSKYIKENSFSGAIRVDPRLFPIGRGLYVPVNPPFVLIDARRPRLFWPSFWKTPGKLNGIPGRVFISILEREMFGRSDFRSLDLDFVDLSCPTGSTTRGARVYNRKDFHSLSDKELAQELEKFVEAYFLAKEPVSKERADSERPTQSPGSDLPLFPEG